MFNFFALLFFTATLAVGATAQTKPELSQPIVFSNVTVIDVKNGRQKPKMTVVVTGNRIASVGRKAQANFPENTQIIDASGKFLIPGLWDMHIHAWDGNAFYPILLANGITGIRDMGGDAKSLAAFRRQIESGERIGPRLFFSGQIIDGLRRENLSFLFSFALSAEDARINVRRLKDGGADFIKVYNALTPDAFAAVIDEARRQNLPFAGHVPISVGVRQASIGGQRSIEHLSGIALASSGDEENLTRQASDLLKEMRQFDNARIKETGDKANELRRKTYEVSNRLYELTDKSAFDTYDRAKAAKLFELFRRQKTWQVPTLAVVGGNSLRTDAEQTKADRLRYFPELVRSLILQSGEKPSPEQLALEKKRFQTKLQIVRSMHRAKISLLAGSDSPNANVYPGFSLHDELEFFVQAGLSPFEALQTATFKPAVYFNKAHELGSIEAGRLADLVLLDANPLNDIKNTRRIRAVMTNGRLLTRETLDKMLADAAAKYQKNITPPK